MKSVTSSSSTKSSSSSSSMGDRSEMRDSCYFPGCRKDTNCSCEICLASINATLDLMPSSAQHSSLTRVVSSTPQRRPTPLLFDMPLTPPLLQSTAKSRHLEENEKKKKEKKRKGFWVPWWGGFVGLLLGVSLIFVVDSGFSWAVSGVFRPVFSVEKVEDDRGGIEGCGGFGWATAICGEEVVDGKVSNCSAADSSWEIESGDFSPLVPFLFFPCPQINDGFLLVHSRCILYKSSAEEVSIWGWPLQTAGLLTTGYTSRSYTILSGRVTEWSEGKMRFSVHKSNSSWLHQKWSASALQLDPNTWVLEYQQNAFLQNSRPCKVAVELLRFRFSKVIQGLWHELWPLIALPSDYYNNHYYYYHKEDGFRYHAT
ncbi:sigma non-opioid intracellular receptor 1 [Cinnamomum micranthum f. kanehirae]|uniref:Sigma non-opioid intracellular receptor 1 n=1 Tax=Cinnamomum micranthum f. kanehirae TaxID=337451 RepID=A0A3S4PDH8_9MAGN|nr:sigma non-opioid intracellular receptor 1 [Cinnamomum micranthum f. kanehirae]